MPNNISEYKGEQLDLLISAHNDAVEMFPRMSADIKRIQYRFPDLGKARDPETEILNVFRPVGDEIDVFCLEFVDLKA